jgi:hypothetical protein
LLILIANFIAALITIVLPLTAILDASWLVLSKVIAGRAGSAGIGRSWTAKVRAGAAIARNRVRRSIASTDLSSANLASAGAWWIRTPSRELRRNAR